MKQTPLVSVVLLNYRRLDALARSLEAARRQSYPHLEIIVVDNGSGDGTRAFVKQQAPEVRLIELESNIGACGGRNAGIAAARGDIIISLDNDILFEGPDEIRKVVDTFQHRPDVHVLAFKVCEEQSGELLVRGWCHPRSWQEYNQVEFETDYFNEAACAARREVYERAGGYYEPLFFGAEGWDLILRMLDQGFRIVYQPTIRVRHMRESEAPRVGRNCYAYTRNYIWTASKNYPLLAGVGFAAPKLAMMLYLALRTRELPAFIKGLRDGLKGFPTVMRERTPVRRSTLRYVRRLEQTRPRLWVRLARHREAVQL